MKYISLVFSFSMISFVSSFALSISVELADTLSAADFLAEKWVIRDVRSDIDISGTPYEMIGGWETMAVLDAYRLQDTITRREMLKIMINISGKDFSDICEGRFLDMNTNDWGCKYAEAALGYWFIAENNTFRPNDSVTKIEALKMIMQAVWIPRDEADDWRDWYISKAISQWILGANFSDYNTASQRGWIFVAGSKTYEDAPDFSESASPSSLTPEEEELLNHFLDI